MSLQLPLALARPQPTFANYVVGRNAEAVAALQALVHTDVAERFVYLWGEPGSGRSHLLAAIVAAAELVGRTAMPFAQWADCAPGTILLADDVHELDAAAQIRLFNAYNTARESGACLVATGDAAPARLPLRPDVVTRLAWGLAYPLHVLTDDEKVDALSRHAVGRGWRLPPEVARYLLRHGRRDLPSLMSILDELDRFSLATRRPVTVPLLRDVLQSAAPLEVGSGT